MPNVMAAMPNIGGALCFFRLSMHALVPKIQQDKVVQWFQNGDFFASRISSKPRAAHFRPAFEIHTKATPCVKVW